MPVNRMSHRLDAGPCLAGPWPGSFDRFGWDCRRSSSGLEWFYLEFHEHIKNDVTSAEFESLNYRQ